MCRKRFRNSSRCRGLPTSWRRQLGAGGSEAGFSAWRGVGSSSRRAWSARISSTGSVRRRLTLSSAAAPYCVTYASDMLDSVGETLLETLSIRFEEACLRAVKGLHLSHERRAQDFSELGLHLVGRYDKRWYTYYCALEVLHKECRDSSSNGGEASSPEQPTLNPTQLAELFSRMTPTELQAKVSSMLSPSASASAFKESIFTDLLRKIFGAIYRALAMISSSSIPTASLCLDELMKLRAVLQREREHCSTDVSKALAYANLGGFLGGKGAHVVLQEVQDVLDKHMKEEYLYLCVPAVLDPRFKLECVAKALSEVCGPSEAAAKISGVKKRMEDTFKEHKQKLGNIAVNGGGEGASSYMAAAWAAAMDVDGSWHEDITGLDDLLVPPEGSEGLDDSDSLAMPEFDDLDIPELDTQGNTNAQEEGIIPDELERYLGDGLLVPRGEEGQGFDVLMWWKDNSNRYPTVASMARDALAMPTSDLLSPEHSARIRSMMSSYCLTYPDS